VSPPAPDDLDAWDFDLPPERIARHPPPARSDARLLVVPRAPGPLRDGGIRDLPGLLRPGDLLVANDSRVVPARLRSRRATGGKVELLVVAWDGHRAEALARPARKLVPGVEVAFGDEVVTIEAAGGDGHVSARFPRPVEAFLADHGEVPLPPYLERDAEAADRERYQTVYAGRAGSVAAPTAGLHFDPALLAALGAHGIGFATVTLHVGIGTFRPLRAEDVARGTLHSERWELPADTARRVAEARAAGGRVIAVGTTAARTLQSATPPGESLPRAGAGTTTLFLKPPDVPSAFDGLLTNFHLPRSSLLMLVATLIGRERLLATYAHAIASGYRFFSYGDAMLVLPGGRG
jgi:S-adenosylmethionine:tRNA ribosyltransferase-isomerase